MVEIFSSHKRPENEKRDLNPFHFIEKTDISVRTDNLFFVEEGGFKAEEELLFWVC